MKTTYFVFIVILLSLSFIFTAADEPAEQKIDPKTISLEDFYQVKPYRGKQARMIAFSPDDRYLSFLWNKIDEQGYDLFVYDTRESKLKQVTSFEKMKAFDPPADRDKFKKKLAQRKQEEKKTQEKYFAQRDFLSGKDVDLTKFEKEELQKLKEELKKEKEKKKKKEAEKEKEKGDKLKKKSKKDKKKGGEKEEEEKELELWELREKLKEWQEKNKVKRGDLYPGVSSYKWAKKTNRLIFTYRGDLFQYFPGEDRIERLTLSEENERLIRYRNDEKGYYYGQREKVYLVNFNSSYIQQINPKRFAKLEEEDKNKMKIFRTSISPDDKWVMIVASKSESKAKRRKVKIMDYKKRFAKVVESDRQVGDDKRSEPEYFFYLRKIAGQNYGEAPQPLFEIPGGDTWYEFTNFYWSEDGTSYAFMTWEREKGDLKIWLGSTAAGEKPELLYEKKEQVGYEFLFYRQLKFSPDGKHLAVILNNEEGFKHLVVFNAETKEKKYLTSGRFEVNPIIGFSKDSRLLYVLADKQNPAMHSVYKVELKTGSMQRIGKTGGMHRTSVVSHQGQWLATTFGNWHKWPELFLINTQDNSEQVLTDSHRREWANLNFIKPELFNFKNRHGDTIAGMIFKPSGWEPGQKRPCIVYVYGGPLGTAHTVESDVSSPLSYMFQMLMAARHGFVTINIDTRGMTGYGRKFSEANFEQVGKPQVEDLEDLVKHIKTGFGVDVEKVGLHGWSFGGFQTLMTMLSSPGTFACGIATASVTEWENYNYWYTGNFIDKLVRGKPHMKKYSLIPLAKNLKKPLLLIHGMQDDNVLFQDTVHIYNALLKAGKETLVELFLDPEGGHGLKGVVPYKSVFKKYEAWFLRHLGTPQE